MPIEPIAETRQGDVPIFLSDCARLFEPDGLAPAPGSPRRRSRTSTSGSTANESAIGERLGLGRGGEGELRCRVAIVTGSGGLIGSDSVRRLIESGWDVVGLENDMRAQFFGPEASTAHVTDELVDRYPEFQADRGRHPRRGGRAQGLRRARFGVSSWSSTPRPSPPTTGRPASRTPTSASTPIGTLNLLEAAREHQPGGDLRLHARPTRSTATRPTACRSRTSRRRLELPEDHPYFDGIDTTMSIDRSTHSLFGVSKAAADLLVQEYGRYFDMPTVCFRGGCLTGPHHAGARLHGFLAYLMKCAVTGTPYTVFGYEGKQVRDNIHGADLVAAFLAFHRAPRAAAVYNIGGGP